MLLPLIAKFPVLASVLMVIGVLRLVNKPLFAFLRTVVDATPTPKDNEILVKIETSKAYKYVSFVLDYLGSVKLPQKTIVSAKPEAKNDAA